MKISNYTKKQQNKIIHSAKIGVLSANDEILSILESSTYWSDLRSVPNPNQIGTQDIFLATLNKNIKL